VPRALLVTLVAAALFLLSGASAPAGAPSPPEPLARSRHALVFGAPEVRLMAQRVAELMDEAVSRIAPVVATSDVSPVPAAIYSDRQEFVRATNLPRDSRVAGLAVFPAGVIYLDGTELFTSIERVVPHEVAHVLMARALGDALPALPDWAGEGVAEYAAGQRASFVDPTALQAIGRGQSLALAELDGAIEARDSTSGLAYAQSTSLVHFLVSEYGEEVIEDLLRSLRHTRDFEMSLLEVTGLDLDELERQWRRSVSRRWGWRLLFRPELIYLVMAVLLVIGVIRHLLERRRRQELPEEDW
jgi:hypothetical protein